MQELVLPVRHEWLARERAYGKIAIEPFEPGFALTAGNAYRRVLLSSIAGSAPTWVKIEGVLHEFSHLVGVREDTLDIILNLRKLVFSLHVNRPKLLRLKAQGRADGDRPGLRARSGRGDPHPRGGAGHARQGRQPRDGGVRRARARLPGRGEARAGGAAHQRDADGRGLLPGEARELPRGEPGRRPGAPGASRCGPTAPSRPEIAVGGRLAHPRRPVRAADRLPGDARRRRARAPSRGRSRRCAAR